MPKATITFKLPEENSEYRMHQKAGDMHSAIWDFTSELRNKTKYGDGKPVDWEDVSQLWWETLKENDIDPYSE